MKGPSDNTANGPSVWHTFAASNRRQGKPQDVVDVEVHNVQISTADQSAPLINQHRRYGLHGIARRPWQDLVASYDLTKWDGCQQSCQYYHHYEDYLNPYPTYGTSSIPNQGTSPVSHGENIKVLNYLRSYTVHSSKQIRVVLELLSYLGENHLLLAKEYENDFKITEHCWWTGKPPPAGRDNGAGILKATEG